MTDSVRFPAEWESQSAILIAWPHAGTDWAERLAEVEDTYIALVTAITRFQPVIICVADDDLQIYAEARLRSARVENGTGTLRGCRLQRHLAARFGPDHAAPWRRLPADGFSLHRLGWQVRGEPGRSTG